MSEIREPLNAIDKQLWYQELVNELYDDGRMGGEG